MKKLALIWITVLGLGGHAFAEDKLIPFNFENEDITKVLKKYSGATGQKFIVSPNVKGQITILNAEPVSATEAFNQLSTALAQNDVGISKQGDEMVVEQARSIQRDLVEVGSTLPAMKPERMYTWVVQMKNVRADDVNRQLRVLTSRDGELVPHLDTNQIVITDWISNLYRVNEILKQIDDPAKVATAKQFAATHPAEPPGPAGHMHLHPLRPGVKETPHLKPGAPPPPDAAEKSEQ